MLRLRAHPLRVVLVGNPNVGKSVVFGALTGRYATVSNYPGTTVSVTKGRALVGAEVCDLVDTPGVNALNGAISEDERITRDVLERGEADLIIQVADARNIRRALMLTAEIAAYRRPAILALNTLPASAQAFSSTELKTGISNSLAVIMMFGFVLGIACVIYGGFAIRRGETQVWSSRHDEPEDAVWRAGALARVVSAPVDRGGDCTRRGAPRANWPPMFWGR